MFNREIFTRFTRNPINRYGLFFIWWYRIWYRSSGERKSITFIQHILRAFSINPLTSPYNHNPDLTNAGKMCWERVLDNYSRSSGVHCRPCCEAWWRIWWPVWQTSRKQLYYCREKLSADCKTKKWWDGAMDMKVRIAFVIAHPAGLVLVIFNPFCPQKQWREGSYPMNNLVAQLQSNRILDEWYFGCVLSKRD